MAFEVMISPRGTYQEIQDSTAQLCYSNEKNGVSASTQNSAVEHSIEREGKLCNLRGGRKRHTASSSRDTIRMLKFSNHFADKSCEESYQLYCSKLDYKRAQHIIAGLCLAHATAVIVHTQVHPPSPTGNDVLPPYTGDIEDWVQWFYLIIAIPFAFVPLKWFEAFNFCHPLVYLLRKRWKRIAAAIVVSFTIGLQLWITFQARKSSKTYADMVPHYVKCADQEGAWNSYFGRASSVTNFIVQKNRSQHMAFTTTISVFLAVLGTTFAISMRLDFLHILGTVIATSGALWGILLAYWFTLWVTYQEKTLNGTILLVCLSSVPGSLVCAASYYADRNARSQYHARINVERENTALKSNITTRENTLRNLDADDYQRKIVALHLGSNTFLQSLAIDFEDITLERVLHVGAVDEVLLGNYLETRVAVKRLRLNHISIKSLKQFAEKVELLACLRHPNITQFIGGSWNSYANICLVTEYMEKGDVYTLLHSRMLLSWTDPLLKWATDIAQGMSYLHNSNPPVIHRDLKSSNLLCSATFCCKVSDFGESKRQLKSLRSVVGTPYWLAPEVLREESYGCSADCYSFGMVLIELETRKDPYHDRNDSTIDIMMGVAQGEIRPDIPSTCLPARRKLIEDCLAPIPSNRPTMSQILQRLQTDILEELVSDKDVVQPRNKRLFTRQVRRNINEFCDIKIEP